MADVKEIKEGFQKTEVGVIPEDWLLRKIINIADICTGNTPPTSDQNNYGNDYFFVGPVDLGKGRLILNTEKKLSQKGFNLSRKYPRNSILVTCIGSTIGKSGISERELTSNQQINAIFPNNTFDSDYLYYVLILSSNRIKQGAGESAVPIINKTEFGQIFIPLPPTLAEQTTIATALNDADALITQLEKLIAKKRAIKQGAMQELLKPKEGWEERKLGEIVKSIQLGGNYKNGERSNSYPLIKMGNIQRGYISLNKIEYTQDCIPDKKDRLKFGDLLFNTRNTLELVGKVAIWRNELQEAYFNSNLMRIEFFPEYVSSNFFINSIFNARYSIQKLKDLATGTTSVAAIYTRDLLKMELSLPSLDDQIRIAQILSDMDSEIEILEKKLEKYKEIKQGMMQELLTGKIRLDH